MQVSPCHPRSSIFRTPTAIPALVFSASKPGGRDGSEKSTVSGFWPTKRMRVIGFLHRRTRESEGPAHRLRGHMSPKALAGNIGCLDCCPEEGEAGWEHVHHALPHVKFRGRRQDSP